VVVVSPAEVAALVAGNRNQPTNVLFGGRFSIMSASHRSFSPIKRRQIHDSETPKVFKTPNQSLSKHRKWIISKCRNGCDWPINLPKIQKHKITTPTEDFDRVKFSLV
jgi:hypothetical protein